MIGIKRFFVFWWDHSLGMIIIFAAFCVFCALWVILMNKTYGWLYSRLENEWNAGLLNAAIWVVGCAAVYYIVSLWLAYRKHLRQLAEMES